MTKFLHNQNGYVISIITFFVLIIMSSIAMSMSFLIASRQKNITNIVKSTQAYYAAEAGVEDALWRLKKNPQMSALEYDINVNNAIANVNIPSTIGASKTITSQASNSGISRKVQTVATLDNSTSVSFYYGAEVGEGGLIMDHGSEIIGNVFSNGNISGSGTIANNAVVSGNGHSIQGVRVEGDAFAYSCLSPANILGDLTYVKGGLSTCSVVGSKTEQEQEISQQPLPIPQSQIDEWKSDAEAGEVFSGNKTISSNQTLGPIKITGNLTINNNVTLNMSGIVYVAGNIYINNGSTIKLDNSYNTLGGVFMADGTIHPSNNAHFLGSGQPGSYILVISNSASDEAISLDNNVSGGVFYTSAGGLDISNNVSVVEATGYKIRMRENTEIQYSSGIANIYFASGPGGGWKVTSWQEQ